MANQIHVVPHFHWDREWYFSAEESKVLLANDMEEIMDMLENHSQYLYFVLDGQTSIMEDYFSVKPEHKSRFRKLVEQGKLIIGPWYTQTDEMVVGGESIVRNLLYGKMDCDSYNSRMMIGYLPDSFGQSARMPQILNGFGITRSMFWRGTSERMGSNKTEFYWEGDDDSKVIVQLLPLGYAIGKYLPSQSDALKERMEKYLPVLDKGATTDHILLPNGHDQMPVQKNIFEVMKQIETIYPGRKTKISKYEDVFDEVEKVENLDTLRGEFLDGKYMRVHRSIYSTRADLKSSNTRIENKITNRLEPLSSMAFELGFEYHHGLIEGIWKELMKNHAHDSIGCCCSDKVHQAIANRFFLAEERTDNLIEFYKRKIVDAMSCEHCLDKLTVFNTLPYERTGVIQGEIVTKMKNFELLNSKAESVPFEIIKKEIVDAGLIDRQIVHYGNYDPFVRYNVLLEDCIPAMGFKTYLVSQVQKKEELKKEEMKSSETMTMENEFYKILICENGTLTVFDKNSKETYEQVLLMEDGSDDGDEYDYSPLEDDFVLYSKEVKAQVKVENYQYLSKAQIKYRMEIPKDLDSRKAKKIDGFMDLQFNIELEKNSKVIKFSIEVDNQAKDHRVRVLIPNKIGASMSISDNQFGIIKRQVVDEAMKVWEEEAWSERPDSIYPFLSFVKGDGEKGFAVLTNSVREYELVGEAFEMLAITVFRGVGVLGKEKLLRRPGRPSGIKMETMDSQMLGKNRYELAITTNIAQAAVMAKEYLSPFLIYNKMPYNAMKLNSSDLTIPYDYSMFSLNNKNIILSTLKKEEKGNNLIIRSYNPSLSENEVLFESKDKKIIAEKNLDETIKETFCRKDRFKFKKNQIRCWALNDR